jgi:hypothetical protein
MLSELTGIRREEPYSMIAIASSATCIPNCRFGNGPLDRPVLYRPRQRILFEKNQIAVFSEF